MCIDIKQKVAFRGIQILLKHVHRMMLNSRLAENLTVVRSRTTNGS